MKVACGKASEKPSVEPEKECTSSGNDLASWKQPSIVGKEPELAELPGQLRRKSCEEAEEGVGGETEGEARAAVSHLGHIHSQLSKNLAKSSWSEWGDDHHLSEQHGCGMAWGEWPCSSSGDYSSSKAMVLSYHAKAKILGHEQVWTTQRHCK